MRWIRILISALFIISLLPQHLSAENARKVAYVNAAKVFDNYYKTKEADEKLEGKAKKKNTERDKLIKEINKLKDEVEVLSKEARKDKETELGNEMRELQDFDRETRLNLQRERDDVLNGIFEEIYNTIKAYGKNNGYDLILDDRILLYADEQSDISDEIIKILNKGK